MCFSGQSIGSASGCADDDDDDEEEEEDDEEEEHKLGDDGVGGEEVSSE